MALVEIPDDTHMNKVVAMANMFGFDVEQSLSGINFKHKQVIQDAQVTCVFLPESMRIPYDDLLEIEVANNNIVITFSNGQPFITNNDEELLGKIIYAVGEKLK